MKTGSRIEAVAGGKTMDGKTTVKYLQTYIKAKDHHPELVKDYFLKLAEEVGCDVLRFGAGQLPRDRYGTGDPVERGAEPD